MRLHYDAETEAFRNEFRAWLADNLPAPEDRTEPWQSTGLIPEWGQRWQRKLFDDGWLVPGWPPAFGGRNATPVQQMVYFEEFARLDVSRTYNPQGLGIVAPSILDFGTEEQKDMFVRPTLRGDMTWCLGMSEPNAGSDLAGLETRAALEGDHFVVNGQKIWTSGAHHADYCLCFVRTDPDAPKHRGISVLLIDMKTDGIEARTLAMLSSPDGGDFNEVFFTDVLVPRGNLLGDLNHGWSIAGGSLAHERSTIWVLEVAGLERSVQNLIERADARSPDGGRLGDDPQFRDMLVNHYIDAQAMRYLGYRVFARVSRGSVAPEQSLLKLFGSESGQRRSLATLEAIGLDGLVDNESVLSGEGPGTFGTTRCQAIEYLTSFGGTLIGGTSEIQRNIIAERVLGLPRR